MFAGARTTLARAALARSLGRSVTIASARALAIPLQANVPSYKLAPVAIARSRFVPGFRSYSVLSQNAAEEYKYEDIKKLVQAAPAEKDTLLIDVREPVEYQEGHIPGALNVPFKSSPGAFDLSEEEFEESFGFQKPDKNKKLVFYCLGGVRSTAAEELADSFGYTKRGNYIGSWEDWISHENASKKA